MNLNGNTESVRRLARKVTLCDGGIDVWFLPYTPALQSLIYRRLKAHSGDDGWSNVEAVFAELDSCIIDAQLLDEDNLVAETIDTYIHNRQGNDPVGNYGLFSQLLSNQAINILWEGFQDTRSKLPPAPRATQESKPPETNPLETSGLPAKKGKRGKKRLEATS